MVPLAGLFPAELTALRAVGLAVALILVVYAVVRRRELRNADVLLLVLAGVALAIVTGTEVVNGLLSAFSFEKGNGGGVVRPPALPRFPPFLFPLRASPRRRWRGSPGRSSARPACPTASRARSRS